MRIVSTGQYDYMPLSYGAYSGVLLGTRGYSTVLLRAEGMLQSSRANAQTNQTNSSTIREHNSIAKCFSTLSVLHFSDIWDSNACRNPDESGNAALPDSRRLNC